MYCCTIFSGLPTWKQDTWTRKCAKKYQTYEKRLSILNTREAWGRMTEEDTLYQTPWLAQRQWKGQEEKGIPRQSTTAGSNAFPQASVIGSCQRASEADKSSTGLSTETLILHMRTQPKEWALGLLFDCIRSHRSSTNCRAVGRNRPFIF